MDKKTTGTKKLKVFSSVLMYASFVLLFMDFFNVTKTYVGGLLLGIAFFIQGMLLKSEKQEDRAGRRNALIIIAMGIAIFIGGIIFLYIDLVGIPA